MKKFRIDGYRKFLAFCITVGVGGILAAVEVLTIPVASFLAGCLTLYIGGNVRSKKKAPPEAPAAPGAPAA